MNISACRACSFEQFPRALAPPPRDGTILARVKIRRGGRVVDGSGLENRQGESPRGFESHPLRCKSNRANLPARQHISPNERRRFESRSTARAKRFRKGEAWSAAPKRSFGNPTPPPVPSRSRGISI